MESRKNKSNQWLKDPKLIRALLISLLFFISNGALLLAQLFGHFNILYILFIYLPATAIAYYLFVIRSKFNFWFACKILLIYLMYQVLSYFVLMTLNINNADFKWFDFVKNHFFQVNYLLPLLYMLGLTLGIFYLKSRPKPLNIRFQRHVSIRENFFIAQFLTAFILSDSKFIDFIERSSFFNVETLVERLSALWYYSWLYLFISFVTYLFIKGITDIINNRVSISSALSMSLLFAILFNYTVQIGIDNKGTVVDRFILPGAFSFQVCLYTGLFFLIYLLSNRFLFSTVFVLVSGTIFSLANAIKYTYRNEPILPSDLGWIKQIGLVLGFVDKGYIFSAIAGILLVGVIYYFIRKIIWVDKVTDNKWLRFSTSFGVVLLFSMTFNILKGNENGKVPSNLPIISTLNNIADINWMGNSVNAKMKSLSFVWVKQLVTPVMEKPKGYSHQKIKEIEAKYAAVAEELNASRKNNIEDQTVIYILSESYSDPTRIPGVQLSKEITPYLNSLRESYSSGLMKSDGYGGGTANMEFQTLTGLPMYNLSPNISTIYTEVASNMPYIPSISDLYSSKNRIAVHLESGANYSRNAIYTKLGFDKFIALTNSDTKATNVKDAGLHPSDASTYQNVLEQLSKDSPQFFSVMTMQNHMPWSVGDPADIVGTGEGFSDEENGTLTSYARLLNITDQATEEFFNTLEKQDKKISVVFYGDHLPGFYPSSSFASDPQLQYETDYVIWSNYETEKIDQPLLNSSDFIAALLETTNSKVSPYYALLTEVMKNSSVDQEKLSSNAQEIADDLKMIEYDLVSRNGYLTKDSSFFKIGE